MSRRSARIPIKAPRSGGFLHWVVTVVLIVVFVGMFAILLSGCKASTPPSTSKTPDTIAGLRDDLADAKQHATEAKQAVEAITPENVNQAKPVALAKSDEVIRDLSKAEPKAAVAAKQSERDRSDREKLAKENADLKQADPVRSILRIIGLGLIGLFTTLAAAWVFFGRNKIVGEVALVSLFAGAMALAFARFLRQIEWIGVGLIIVVLIIVAYPVYGWLRKHWRSFGVFES